LTDVQGRILTSGQTLEGETVLDLSSYATGVYMIRLGSGDSVRFEKVVKE
jgi:hypothetical protein